MASIFDWSSTAGSNTTCDGINCATGMPVGNTDNLFRSIMAIIRQSFSATLQSFLSGASALGISSGGTGATTAADARTALGLGSAATESTVPIAKGGTGATTAATAFANIAVAASSIAAPGYIKLQNGLIIQWTKGAATSGEGTQSVSWPLTFPSACFVAVCGTGISSASNDADGWCQVVGDPTTTGCTIQRQYSDAGTGNALTPIIIAVGN